MNVSAAEYQGNKSVIEFLPPVSLASVGTYVVDRIFVCKAVKTGEAQVGEGSPISHTHI